MFSTHSVVGHGVRSSKTVKASNTGIGPVSMGQGRPWGENCFVRYVKEAKGEPGKRANGGERVHIPRV